MRLHTDRPRERLLSNQPVHMVQDAQTNLYSLYQKEIK